MLGQRSDSQQNPLVFFHEPKRTVPAWFDVLFVDEPLQRLLDQAWVAEHNHGGVRLDLKAGNFQSIGHVLKPVRGAKLSLQSPPVRFDPFVLTYGVGFGTIVDTMVLGPCCQPRISRPNVLMLLNNLDKVLCSEACCGFDEVEESMLRCGRKGCPSPHRFEIAMLAAWRVGARNGAVLRAVRGVSTPAILVFAASARVAPQQDFETRGLSVPLMANLQDTILHQTTGPVFLVVQEGFFCCKRRFNRKGRRFDWVDVIAVCKGSATCLNSLCFRLPFRRCRSLCMRFRFRAFASPIHCGQRPQAERYPHLSKCLLYSWR